jgi:hypothetical protein
MLKREGLAARARALSKWRGQSGNRLRQLRSKVDVRAQNRDWGPFAWSLLLLFIYSLQFTAFVIWQARTITKGGNSPRLISYQTFTLISHSVNTIL